MYNTSAIQESFPNIRAKFFKVNMKIALFKSLRNCKRRNKINFTLRSNSNKIMLCDGCGQHYLF